jgi:ABC transporter substrate binding protein
MWIGFFVSPELLVAGEAMDRTLARNVVASPLHIGMVHLTSLVSRRFIAGLPRVIVPIQLVRLKGWNVRFGSKASRRSRDERNASGICRQNATTTIPIVMAAIGEPVGTGMVGSLAKPGGNVTGLSAFVNELAAKRAEIMREIVPKISRMAMIDNMGNASVPAAWDEMKKATLAFGIQPLLYDVRKPEDIGAAFDAAIAQHVDALTVGNDSVFITSRLRVVELAAKHHPTIYAHAGVCRHRGLVVLRSTLS